jgi:hypothetical protein
MDTARQHRFLIYARRTGGGAEGGTLDLLDWSNRTAQPCYQRGIILAWSKQCPLRLPARVCDRQLAARSSGPPFGKDRGGRRKAGSIVVNSNRKPGESEGLAGVARIRNCIPWLRTATRLCLPVSVATCLRHRS